MSETKLYRWKAEEIVGFTGDARVWQIQYQAPDDETWRHVSVTRTDGKPPTESEVIEVIHSHYVRTR